MPKLFQTLQIKVQVLALPNVGGFDCPVLRPESAILHMFIPVFLLILQCVVAEVLPISLG